MKYLKIPFLILSESKKARALIVGLVMLGVMWVAGLAGAEDQAAEAEPLVEKGLYLLIAYIVGQGIADHGKEKARVEAAAKSGPADTLK